MNAERTSQGLENAKANQKERPVREVQLTAEVLGDPEHRRKHFEVSRDVKLLEVLQQGAERLEVQLLPSAEDPLDHLRGLYGHHEVSQALDLGIVLEDFLESQLKTHHFAIELVLAIRVNTRWRVAPSATMTPRAILELADLSPNDYSLYFPPDSVQPLPPDSPIELHRGQRFEAQRDGKYGEGV